MFLKFNFATINGMRGFILSKSLNRCTLLNTFMRKVIRTYTSQYGLEAHKRRTNHCRFQKSLSKSSACAHFDTDPDSNPKSSPYNQIRVQKNIKDRHFGYTLILRYHRYKDIAVSINTLFVLGRGRCEKGRRDADWP